MIKITFKNLERSELAKQAVEEKMKEVVNRFPDLTTSNIQVTLSMENSPRQAGPDLFRVKTLIHKSKYHGVILEKQSPSLYAALAEVSEHLLERLNRFGDKKRVKARRQERRMAANSSEI
jgi:ribosomal subunit interface protein